MALTKATIQTVADAYAWAQGSAKVARAGVCPSQAAVYTALAQQVAAMGPMSTLLVGGLRIAWDAALSYADSACTSSPDYKKGGASIAAKIDPVTGGAQPGPEDLDLTGAGLSGGNVLIWLLVGAGAYLLWQSSKKGKKGGKRKAKRKTRRRRR